MVNEVDTLKFANVVINSAKTPVIKLDEGFLPLSSLSKYVKYQSNFGYIEEVLLKPSVIRLLNEILEEKREELRSSIISEHDIDGFLPCVTKPGKIIGIGLNYVRHAKEEGAKIPDEPIIFSKFSNTLAGHLEDIPIPKTSKQVDYEGELGIFIGKKAVNVPKDEALTYVSGYFIANDVSARDLQSRSGQWLLGKTCNKFAPIGPYIVTSDKIPNPNNLKIRTYVNGELRQNSNTSDMIFYCNSLISYISEHFPLDPGDIILTGTPEGVIVGKPQDQRVWLKNGDVVRVEIENLGVLENRFVDLPR